MTHADVKEELLRNCREYVNKRTRGIKAGIADLEEALKLETRCSMGDKYETGRAMLHLEFEKLSSQLEQYERLQKTLSFIRKNPYEEKITFGCVVKTSKANYFISIPAGEMEAGGDRYFCVGANSPIAQALIGKTKGDTFSFNENRITVLEIF